MKEIKGQSCKGCAKNKNEAIRQAGGEASMKQLMPANTSEPSVLHLNKHNAHKERWSTKNGVTTVVEDKCPDYVYQFAELHLSG